MKVPNQNAFSGLAGKIGVLLFVAICPVAFNSAARAQTVTVAPVCQSLTAGNLTYSTDFNTLAASGTTNTAVPAGFGFSETGTSASVNGQYIAGTGSGTAGDTYSFGTAATDRAFGSLQSGTNNPIIGACFVNNTGSAVASLTVTYDGEQYRLGTAGRQDRLDFQYSVDPAATLNAGTYTDFNALDFLAPVTTGTVGAIDGNAAGKATVSSSIGSLNIPDGSAFYIRYLNFDAAGADDALAIDNFSLTAVLAAPTAATVNVRGRVTDSRGRGIFRAMVLMTDGNGDIRYAQTNSFGYYLFPDVEVGQTLILSVRSKRVSFSQPTRIVSLTEDANAVDFEAYETGSF